MHITGWGFVGQSTKSEISTDANTGLNINDSVINRSTITSIGKVILEKDKIDANIAIEKARKLANKGKISDLLLDRRLDHTIGVATCSGDLYSRPDHKISYIFADKPKNLYKYTIKHDAQERLLGEKDEPIMNRIGSIIERK